MKKNKMTVKELIEELEKYPEDTTVIIENHSDDYWITYIEEPWLDFEEEIKYHIDEDWRMYYANGFKWDWVAKNVLIIK